MSCTAGRPAMTNVPTGRLWRAVIRLPADYSVPARTLLRRGVIPGSEACDVLRFGE